MPELQAELEKLRRVQAARAAMELGGAATMTADPEATRAPTAKSADSPLHAPGYSIVRELGRGGQAVVYLAVQLNTGRRVALKIMRDGPLAGERAVARFEREVQALAALNHPNIVAIFDTGRTVHGSQFLVMNYIAGSTLDEYMKQRQMKDPTDPSKLLRLFLKICAAINVAHMRGIVHRDLKPSNIRIDERGEPQILDFGLARTAMDHFIRGSGQPISITGEFLGSLPWSSPEQAEGDPDKIDIRTDVYSLGVILYQILTGGKFPYEVVGNIRDVLNNILTADPTPPSKVVATFLAKQSVEQRRPSKKSLSAVNEAIEKIVLKALAKKREQRYQSAGELGRDIANYLSGQRTTAIETDQGATTRSFTKVFLKRTGLAIAACLLVGVIVFGATEAWRRRTIQPVKGTAQTPIVESARVSQAQVLPQPVVVHSANTTNASGQETPPLAQIPSPVAVVTSASLPEILLPQGPPNDAATYLGHHYKLFPQELSWSDAAQHCQEMGGHLADPATIGRLAFLQQLKGNQTVAWVGGSANAKGSWTWSDGTPIQPSLIEGRTQSNEYRWLFVTRNGNLSARPQDGRIDGAAVPMVQGFICEWNQ